MPEKILKIGGKKVKVVSKKKKQLATKTYVDRRIRAESELKYSSVVLHTLSPSTTVSTLSWLNICNNPLAQGVADYQRVGDSVTLKSIHLKGAVNYGDNTNMVRIIVFLWKPLISDVAPTAGSILSYTPWAANPVQAYKLVDRARRPKQARILYDKTVYVNNLSAPQKAFSFNYKFKTPIKMNFDQGSATNGWNVPHIQIMSDSAAATHPAVEFSGRLYYTDN